MSDVAIRVENLGKQYRIGARQAGYSTIRETVTDLAVAPLRRLRRLGQPAPAEETIWALKDVSFEVKQGEVVGIIGRNGAGKTTLLKILSRITEPTEGRAEILGRVGSLLEVGTGFHPELTGRENIYLNGAILGMKRAEIHRKFDEIVEFAEIERFLDTPVKRYSSGMHVRLAFAVAAHLEPEILLVDEVLSVGDAAFQKKCLGKMGDVAEEGRTVLFVSHKMTAVESLCTRALQIDRGRIALSGGTEQVISSYLAETYRHSANPFLDCPRSGTGKIRVVGFRLESPSGEVLEFAQSGRPIVFGFEFENHGCGPGDRVSFGLSVHTEREIGIFHHYSDFSDTYFQHVPASGIFKCLISDLPLAPGNYLVGCRVLMNGNRVTGEEVDWPRVYVPITVVGADFYGVGNSNVSTWGPILVRAQWSLCVGEHNDA